MGEKRRNYGTGSVFQDKHGQWWAKIPLGDGSTRRARAASEKEAERTLKAMRAERDAGVDLRTSRERCETFLDRWLVGLQEREAVKASTLKFYARHAGYAAAEFGQVAMEKLRAHHWRDAQAALLKAGLSRRSVNHVQTVLGTAFAQAVADKIIKENPFASVDRLPLGADAFEAHPLDDDELAAFLDACEPERLDVFFRFILDHGLRHGEARSLKRSDVFLDAVDRHGNPVPHFFIRDSKSKAGKRRMPLTAAWAAALREHYITVDAERAIAERRAVELAKAYAEKHPGKPLPAMRRWTDHGYVFPSEVGTKLGEQNVVKVKQRILQRAELCDPCAACQTTGETAKGERCKECVGRGVLLWKIRVHDLRHTAITDWIASGASPKAAQHLAGHSDPSVTMKIYAKSREESERAALEATAERREQRRKKGLG